jgi:23S rRNA (cytidine2498-2'-O)-methyltransferase
VSCQMEPDRAVMTCDPESEPFALRELREIFADLMVPTWLDDGIALLKLGGSFGDFAARLAVKSPIYVRHVAPVQWEVPLHTEATDLDALLARMPEIAVGINPAHSFAVQARILGEGKLPYRKFTLNSTLSAELERLSGAAMECRQPRQIVSVLCTPKCAYLGLSHVEENRSAWPGGEHRFKRDDEQISRAEFKLLEAFHTFDLELPEQGRALDLGAAPGGWTRVLRGRGLNVTAVDPADLDARFRRDPGVEHVRKQVEAFLPTAKNRFVLLVNDMRKDPLDSVEIMLQAAPLLLPGALAVLTLKLPHEVGGKKDTKKVDTKSDTLATVRLCLQRLQRTYKILGARQLYHNRSEVTVGMVVP